MYLGSNDNENGIDLLMANVGSAFGDLFIKKVKAIVESTHNNPQVRNGHKKIMQVVNPPSLNWIFWSVL